MRQTKATMEKGNRVGTKRERNLVAGEEKRKPNKSGEILPSNGPKGPAYSLLNIIMIIYVCDKR